MTLDVIALKKTYGNFSVSLDFSVGAGETLAIVGPSGSGKTTALNLVSGLAECESGQLISGGADISTLPCWKRNISVVFQDLALFPHLDVGRNIAYGLFIKKVPAKERRRVIEEMLDLVRLPGFASRRIHTLSGGERQRVAIARALASSPRALLLDEPFSSLDAPLRNSLRREFLEIRKGSAHSETPCIFVTHDQEEAVMLGDRVALMSEGRIVECAPGRDLILSPKHEFTARFFGAGQLLPCEILEIHEARIEVSSPLGFLAVPPGRNHEPATEEFNENPMMFIPNDAISLEDKTGAAGWKVFSARFVNAFFKGRELCLSFTMNGEWEELAFEVVAGARTRVPAEGSVVSLWVDQGLVRFVG